jgi:ferredoxin
MQVDPVKSCNSLECIRCGQCIKACPVDALSFGVMNGKEKKNEQITASES